jgi:hypothetical protein
MLAYATSLLKLERVRSVDAVFIISLLLHRVEKLTAFIGGVYSVNKVLKLTYYLKLLKLCKLVLRRCSSKLLLLPTYSVTIYYSLNNKVNNIACAAYVVVSYNIDI